MTAREPPEDGTDEPGIDAGPDGGAAPNGESPAAPDGEAPGVPAEPDVETGADKTARTDAGDDRDDMASSNEQPSDDAGPPSSTVSGGDERRSGDENDRAADVEREHTDSDERTGRDDRADRDERTGRDNRTGRADRVDRDERTGRDDRADRGDSPDNEGRRVDGGDGDEPDLDPLDVTEEDLDTADVDQEDLDRLAELLDEARDDPDAVEGRDLEDMLTVFDDAGIDTRNLEVEDLEERFDESLKVARMLVTAAANTSEYAGLAGLRAGSRMAEAAFTSESPRDLLEETTDIARDELGRLGLPFGSAGRTPAASDRSEAETRRSKDDEEAGPITVADLRRRGERLLELSADVDHEEPFHPAYVRIIEQLSADEARVLRLLATEGPQPALDVYDKGLLPIGGGTLVADGLTMLDTDAGLRYEDRSDIYIDNLERLGLLELGTDPLRNLEQYRVLQAQPNVERAEESARRPSTKRRSVRLTPMGIDFCRTVFPFELDDRYEGIGNGTE